MPKSARVEPTGQEYASLFVGSPLGERILEHLTRKFARPPVYDGGIDGIRRSDFRAGARSVIEYIVAKSNVEEEDTFEEAET
jgi:hypothetical protein